MNPYGYQQYDPNSYQYQQNNYNTPNAQAPYQQQGYQSYNGPQNPQDQYYGAPQQYNAPYENNINLEQNFVPQQYNQPNTYYQQQMPQMQQQNYQQQISNQFSQSIDYNNTQYGGMSQYMGNTQGSILEQWASRVIHASEGAIGYSSANLCGETHQYPKYGDNRKTYRPRKDKGISRIDVGFAAPVFLSKVEIFETNNPGSIIEISARKRFGQWIGLYRGTNQQGFQESFVLRPTFPTTQTSIDTIRIIMDHMTPPQIDGIKIHGIPSNDKLDYSETFQKMDIHKMFVDYDFGPERAGLPNVASWKRPCELVTNPQFVVDDVDVDDINQGVIGDCYLLASLACMANAGRLIEKTFVSHDIAHGKYVFRFLRRGLHAEDVIIDDRLPVDVNGRLMCTSSKTKNEFWMPLLEKAYAKFRGGYDKIEGGQIRKSLHRLCGGKKFYFRTREQWKNIDAAWKQLVDMHSKGAFFGCSSDDDETSTNDLVTSHAYSVLKLAEIDVHGKKQKLILLRNPWGTKEFSGRFSDSDVASWTVDLIINLDAKFSDDGSFWMTFEDFYSQFERVNGIEF